MRVVLKGQTFTKYTKKRLHLIQSTVEVKVSEDKRSFIIVTPSLNNKTKIIPVSMIECIVLGLQTECFKSVVNSYKVSPETCFSIVRKKGKTVDLCASNIELAESWFNGLHSWIFFNGVDVNPIEDLRSSIIKQKDLAIRIIETIPSRLSLEEMISEGGVSNNRRLSLKKSPRKKKRRSDKCIHPDATYLLIDNVSPGVEKLYKHYKADCAII
eukprot:TRINITY_DN978_c0_g1_i1.p1 TRINITY_DN978_c0_g1~~TRINITY_DN978_c0_g1_i1.p1  ORF type:complete len:213 (-),score=22.88 TRINITY_DN978_c0_g1_i1:63-701(-)